MHRNKMMKEIMTNPERRLKKKKEFYRFLTIEKKKNV
jgi:hypothetical protein